MKPATFKRGWQRWLADTDEKPVTLPKAPWEKDQSNEEDKGNA